ncbi:MAG: MBL fold metallo-hydrolase [Simkaniaceae bacterium]|nr:MBL fold metallo-hydrolase [Simkaniaceae bacterium]
MGIPVAGCLCPVCQSGHPSNDRLRPAALIQDDANRTFVIDMGPDFRFQALKYQIHQIDGILITHTHYDHIAGLDEIRSYHFRQGKPIPILLSRESYYDCKIRYYYLPDLCLKYTILDDAMGTINFEGLPLTYLSYRQAMMQVLGFRMGQFAYITDIQEHSDEVIGALQGVETLVVSALRWSKSPVHLTIDEAVAFSEKVGAKKTYFTHIAHELDHESTNKVLPKNIQLAYDGLELII